MTRQEAINFLIKKPYMFGHLLGFTKLTKIHNKWIQDMILGKKDKTLQAHRESYKTTCVSLSLAIIIIVFPNHRTMFMRKTDTDIKEVIRQVKKILESPKTQYFVSAIYGVDLKFVLSSASEISTNLTTDTRGTPQLVGVGTGSSLTGKHFDRIFTDDIINILDRQSKAERDRIKLIYQELQNIVSKDGGRIFNTGTPWHADDAFSLMPEPEKWDCYSTGLMSEEQIRQKKESMTASLFAANYEMRHIASENVIFQNAKTGADPQKVEQGECHIDASYGGEDGTAFTIITKKREETGKDENGQPVYESFYYVFGKLWHKHVDECLSEVARYIKEFNAGRVWCEDNGDKGYLAKELKRQGQRAVPYHENQNKFIKITSYLKSEWNRVVFVAGTDKEYIQQIEEYNENAEHDDAPDSLASIVRQLWAKKESASTYRSPLG